MAGFEDYVNSIYDVINNNLEAIGLVKVYDEIDWEKNIPNEAAGYPFAMVDVGPSRYTKENQTYKTYSVIIYILVNLDTPDSQDPIEYSAARATAADIADALADNYLRHIQSTGATDPGWEEPESVDIEPGLARLGSRNVYAVQMTVEVLSPRVRA